MPWVFSREWKLENFTRLARLIIGNLPVYSVSRKTGKRASASTFFNDRLPKKTLAQCLPDHGRV